MRRVKHCFGFLFLSKEAASALRPLLLAALCIFFHSVSHAVPQAAATLEDPFYSLEKEYWQARKPRANELGGWFSGRCFFASNRMTSAVLIFQDGWLDRGPLFKKKPITKLLFLKSDYADEARYDDLSTEERRQIEVFAEANFAITPLMEHDESSLVVNYGNTSHYVRKAGDSFYSRWEDQSGKTYNYCYFFSVIKEHP